MRLDEMVDILAIDSNDYPYFRPEQRLPDPYDILTICSTLVNVSHATISLSGMWMEEWEKRRRIRWGNERTVEQLSLAHFSVKEYLVSDRIRAATVCRYYMAEAPSNVTLFKTCLKYLSYFEKSSMLTAQPPREFPFIEYAALQWMHHYRCINDESNRKEVENLVYDFLLSKDDRFINWRKCFNLADSWIEVFLIKESEDKSEENRLLTNGLPLYYMSFFGATGVVEKLLATVVDINPRGRFYGSALVAASAEGHETIVRLLLEKGADFNFRVGTNNTALRAASYEGHENIVRILLEKGADVNIHGEFRGSALQGASEHGYETIVKLLLEKGADVNLHGGFYGSALQGASRYGHEKVVKLLLEKGADVNIHWKKSNKEKSPLKFASERGAKAVVRVLLRYGAHDYDKEWMEKLRTWAATDDDSPCPQALD